MDPVAQIRLLIPDETEPQMFTDAELQTYLDLAEGDIYLATAEALEALATKMVFAGGATKVSTDDLRIEDSETIKLLYDRAARFRDKSAAAVNDDFQVVYPFGGDVIPEATPAPWNQPWRWGRTTW